MEIARKMAGYSLGGADLLRRAMGKKIKAAMDAEKPKFLEGAAANGVPKAKAEEVWNLLERFANYGFNKSHAAAYAVVSYQTAWLKANHPVEFMAAVMNCDIHLTDKLSVYKQEVDRLGIEIEPPCVNRSSATFAVRDGRILYATGALKNVGVEAMRLFELGRAEGPYTDLFDVARRVDLRRVGKRPLEMLVRAGGFDALERNRRRVFDSLETLVAYSATAHDDRASSQVNLFGSLEDALPLPRLADSPEWSPMERLAQEHLAVGFYLSGHPLDDFAGALRRQRIMSHAELVRSAIGGGARHGRLAGTVAVKEERKSARGTRIAYVKLSDPTGLFEVMLFSDVLEAARADLEPGCNVVLGVEATVEGEEVRLLARSVQPIEAALANAPSVGHRIFLGDAAAVESLSLRLRDARAKGARRGGPVSLVVTDPALPFEVELTLPEPHAITPPIASAIRHIPGVIHTEEF
jgi:DNA polymerase III subunit alpha